MRSALYVTTKQFCKRAWFGALLAVGMLVMGPLLFLVLTRMEGLNLDFMEHDLTGYHFAYLGLSWIAFLGVSLQALAGCQKSCLSLPVSSRAIATWLMFAMVGLVVVLQLVTNGLYRALFFDENWLNDYWPLLGPLLFLVTLILVGHSVFWCEYAPSFTRLFLAAGLIGAMFWWFISRYYPNGFKAEIVPWSHVTLSEFVTMQVVCVAAWYQGTRAFGKVRSGEAVPSHYWEQMIVWWNALLTGAIPEQQMEPLSRWTSLARLHWRDSCRRAVIVGGVMFGLFILTINLLMGSRHHSGRVNLDKLYELTEGYLIITMLVCIIASVIVAVLLGEGICNTGRTEMKRFLAMAPLIDEDVNATLFRNMVKSFVLVFVCIQGALLISLGVMAVLHGAEVFRMVLAPRFLSGGILVYILLTAIGFWTIAANIISVFWTGRNWFIASAVGVCFGGLFFYTMIINLLQAFFPRNIFAELIIVGMLLTPCLLILGGTLAAYVSAYRKQQISGFGAFSALLFWIVGVSGILIWVFDSSPQKQWAIAWIFSALLTLIIAPFATIPLALSWNRHR